LLLGFGEVIKISDLTTVDDNSRLRKVKNK
jgi:hypothetical protein